MTTEEIEELFLEDVSPDSGTNFVSGEAITPAVDSDESEEGSVIMFGPDEEDEDDEEDEEDEDQQKASSTSSSFEEWVNNDMNTKPSERVRFILGACYGVVPRFSLKVPPYNTLSSQQKPTKVMLVKEVRRRNPK